MMRKIFLPLLTFGILTMPVYGQAPQHGLKMDDIAFHYMGEVVPGQADRFK